MQTDVQAKSKSLLGVSDLTLMAPIKRGLIPALDARSYESRLRLLLKTLSALRASSLEAEPTPLIDDMIDRIRAIHSFRLVIVGVEPKMLVLSVAFDGGWEPYMRLIWRDLGPLLDVIFINCEGYLSSNDHGFAAYAGWVRSAQVSTEFFYNATGLSVNDLHYLRCAEKVRLDGKAPAPPKAPPLPQAPPLPKSDIVELALPAVTALYRLTDMYPPELGLVDGRCLRHAALHLLPALRKHINNTKPPPSGRTPTEQAALRWFAEAEKERPCHPKAAELDPPAGVQGGILEPYANLSHACLLLVELRDAAAVQALLEHMQPLISSAKDQRAAQPALCANLAFTVQGLQLAGVEGGTLEELPTEFRQGMAARASILGDLRHNHPTRWALPQRNWPQPDPAKLLRVELSSVHAVVQMAVSGHASAQWQDLVDNPTHPLWPVVKAFDAELAPQGVRILSVQAMQRFADNAAPHGRDRFGFADGISQPVLKETVPATKFSDRVELGDLLLGYENSLCDRPRTGRLWDDSTFLVVRKLRQDVQGLKDLEAQFPMPTGLLKSRLMGRTVDGENLVDNTTGNDFNYDDDREGEQCPIQSHVRRANPRTPRQPHAAGHALAPPVPRIIRRGMSYGPPADPNSAADRGLVFMAYNASIAEQYEVIQSWLSGANSSQERSYSALRDPFLGVAQDDDPRSFVFHDDAGDEQRVTLPPADKPLVTVEWGLYLFVPSMKAMEELHDRAREAATTEAALAKAARTGTKLTDEEIRAIEKREDRRDIERSVLAQKGAAVIAALRQLEQVQGFDAAKARWKIALEDVSARMSGTSQAVWAAVRKLHGGVLRTPYGVLVCTKAQVMEVLDNGADLYTATGYAERMDKSFGNIYLGMDAGEPYRQQSTEPNAAIEAVSIADGFSAAFQQTQTTVAAFLAKVAPGEDITVDVKDIIDEVLAGLSTLWFGIPDGSHVVGGGWHWAPDAPPTCPGHFHSPSRYMFQPNPGEEAAATGKRHGKALNKAVRQFVDAHRSANTIPQALLAEAIFEAFPHDAESCTRTLIGVMMGFLPTVDGNLRGTLYEWVNDRSLWDHQTAYLAHPKRNAFARARTVLLPPLRRALQLRPVPELTWRIALESHPLGAVQVNAGDTVVLSLVSAMQECRMNEDRDIHPLFGGDRGEDPHPTHACPGYKMAMGVMLGTLAGLLESASFRPTLSPMALRLSPMSLVPAAPKAGPAPAPGHTASAAG